MSPLLNGAWAWILPSCSQESLGVKDLNEQGLPYITACTVSASMDTASFKPYRRLMNTVLLPEHKFISKIKIFQRKKIYGEWSCYQPCQVAWHIAMMLLLILLSCNWVNMNPLPMCKIRYPEFWGSYENNYKVATRLKWMLMTHFIYFDDIVIHCFLETLPGHLKTVFALLDWDPHTPPEIHYMVLCCNSPYAHQLIHWIIRIFLGAGSQNLVTFFLNTAFADCAIVNKYLSDSFLLEIVFLSFFFLTYSSLTFRSSPSVPRTWGDYYLCSSKPEGF